MPRCFSCCETGLKTNKVQWGDSKEWICLTCQEYDALHKKGLCFNCRQKHEGEECPEDEEDWW